MPEFRRWSSSLRMAFLRSLYSCRPACSCSFSSSWCKKAGTRSFSLQPRGPTFPDVFPTCPQPHCCQRRELPPSPASFVHPSSLVNSSGNMSNWANARYRAPAIVLPSLFTSEWCQFMALARVLSPPLWVSFEKMGGDHQPSLTSNGVHLTCSRVKHGKLVVVGISPSFFQALV